MKQNAETAIYLIGILALAALAAAVFHGCAVAPTTRPACDPDVAHRELVLCVTDADVPSTTEQMAQVGTGCAARAALKSCPALGEGAGR